MTRPHADAVRLAEAVAAALTVPKPGDNATAEDWSNYEFVRSGRAGYVTHVLAELERDGVDLCIRILAAAPQADMISLRA